MVNDMSEDTKYIKLKNYSVPEWVAREVIASITNHGYICVLLSKINEDGDEDVPINTDDITEPITEPYP